MIRFANRGRRPSVLARSAQLAVASLLAFGLIVVAAWAANPVASFTFTPTDPVQGEQVRFTSTSTDSDGRIEETRWDLDNDGSFDDGSATTVMRSYTCTSASASCQKTVRLRVEDDDEDRHITSRTFTVRPNAAPVAAFSASPESPLTNESITLTSSSSDPDGRPLTERWDTDNDGSFDDGTGRQITRSGFSSNGPRTMRLQVTDSGGAVTITTRTITIRNRLPIASFNVSATEVDTGQAIQFTSTSDDPDGDIELTQWDLDNDGQFDDATGNSFSRSFPDNGTRTVSIRVTDDDDESQTASRQLTIRNRLPFAAFEVSETEVDSGDPVELTSTSSDPDGVVELAEWDLDGDGQFDDATGNEVTHSFPRSGQVEVGLKVTDDDGGSRDTSREVTVRNRPPRASFTYSPNAPFTGDQVVLTSTSTDPDGDVEEFEWDLDDDGQFDDAEGAQVSTSFGQPGSYQIGLRVRDDNDRTSTTFDTIDVTTRPDPPASNQPGGGSGGGGTDNALGRRALNPFPSIRIRGMTTATGARIDLLSVRTPGGTRILVRCKGGSCPFARRLLRARFRENRVRTLRLPGFNRRHVRAGTVIQIFVIDDGVVGKYTRFVIRRGLRAPKRVDRCTVPGRFRARRCPG